MKIIAAAVLVIIVIACGVIWFEHRSTGPKVAFRTAAITQGELVATIGASGTVEPEEVIDVGAQVAGQINSFGPDPKHPNKTIDYGTEVEKDTILAEIDRTLYAADTANAEAQLAQAKANLRSAEANIAQLDAKLSQTQSDWDRYQKMGPQAVSQTDYDAAKANYLSAGAMRKVGDATVEQAKASIGIAESALTKAKRNEEYCTIKSPVKGVIIDRRVNIGQTVVSSLNTPSLFLIAKDLKRLQVWASVNEADIGKIKAGQQATFSVDTFPGRTFKGTVSKVRLNASMTQNVVTYTVEIVTDNSDGTLFPYLTANVQFETDRHTDVLLAPNAAMRWVPQAAQIDPEFREQYTGDNAINAAGHGIHKHVWIVKDNGLLKPVDVTTGLTDGISTEIQGDIKTGENIVIGDQQTAGDSTANPFMPNFGGKKK